jgi:hypothetical protein
MWEEGAQARLLAACCVEAVGAAPALCCWQAGSPCWWLALAEAAPLMAPVPPMPALLALALEGCLLPLGASAVGAAAPPCLQAALELATSPTMGTLALALA